MDYTFAQVSVDSPVVDHGLNCGNMASAVAPVALQMGLLPRPDDGPLTVRIHATNTGQLIAAELQVASGRAVTSGDFALDGVAGTGSPLRLAFLSPGGAMTGRLLPAGNPADMLEVDGLGEVEVSLVDAANPVVFVAAESLASAGLALTGAESPDELEAIDGVEPALERIRLAAAAAVPGTLPHRMRHAAGEAEGGGEQAVVGTPGGGGQTADGTLLRIGHPSGVTPVTAHVEQREDGTWHAREASLFRTARILMRGEVRVRA